MLDIKQIIRCAPGTLRVQWRGFPLDRCANHPKCPAECDLRRSFKAPDSASNGRPGHGPDTRPQGNARTWFRGQVVGTCYSIAIRPHEISNVSPEPVGDQVGMIQTNSTTTAIGLLLLKNKNVRVDCWGWCAARGNHLSVRITCCPRKNGDHAKQGTAMDCTGVNPRESTEYRDSSLLPAASSSTLRAPTISLSSRRRMCRGISEFIRHSPDDPLDGFQ